MALLTSREAPQRYGSSCASLHLCSLRFLYASRQTIMSIFVYGSPALYPTAQPNRPVDLPTNGSVFRRSPSPTLTRDALRLALPLTEGSRKGQKGSKWRVNPPTHPKRGGGEGLINGCWLGSSLLVSCPSFQGGSHLFNPHTRAWATYFFPPVLIFTYLRRFLEQ